MKPGDAALLRPFFVRFEDRRPARVPVASFPECGRRPLPGTRDRSAEDAFRYGTLEPRPSSGRRRFGMKAPSPEYRFHGGDESRGSPRGLRREAAMPLQAIGRAVRHAFRYRTLYRMRRRVQDEEDLEQENYWN